MKKIRHTADALHQVKKPVFKRQQQKDVIISLLQRLDTDYARSVIDLLVNNTPCKLEGPKPEDYMTPADYLADVQAYALVSKHQILTLEGNLSPDDVALDKFYEAELACQKTNYRFKHMNFTFSERSTLELARAYCHMILKEVDFVQPDFGPGSTKFLRGQDCNIIAKLSALPETTSQAYEHVVKGILHYMPHYAISCGMVIRDRTSVKLGSRLAQIVESSEFLTVPKNYKTARGIAIEPSGMMLMQKGYGSAIRTRLRQFCFDLDIAPNIHGRLAREGSVNGKFATIDLASASDTIAREFVRFMLPVEWYDALDAVRCKVISIGSHKKRLEKFSSMGNGFTFELESLLFLCLMLACRKQTGFENTQISVFGDDMICHPQVAEQLIPILNTCGFTVNWEKTYLTGPFRESCGHDYFLGQRVTPVYFKEKSDDSVSSIYYYLNRIVALSSAFNFGIGNSGRFKRVWMDLLQRLDPRIRYGGPATLGDIVIHGLCRRTNRHGRIACLARKSRYFKRFSTADHVLACAIYGVPSHGVVPRGVKYTLSTQWLTCSYTGAGEVLWITET